MYYFIYYIIHYIYGIKLTAHLWWKNKNELEPALYTTLPKQYVTASGQLISMDDMYVRNTF